MQRSKTVLFLLFLFLNASLYSQYVTYHSDVKPILEKHCVSCHQKGAVGAMPLTTYEEVASYGTMIQYVTTSKLMPPWYADTSYSHFKNERALSESEIQAITGWVEGDMKEGAMPYGQIISSTVGVTVLPRDPDLVISMKESFEQYGIYMDQYQVFVLPANLKEDQWIEGIEFVPGNKKIVRGASISVSESGSFDSLDRWDPRYGFYSFGGVGKETDQPFWYTWSPLQTATFYEEGQAKFLPKGSDLIMHIHYGPTGIPLKDSSEIRLWFGPKKIQQQIFTEPLINPSNLSSAFFFIEPNTKKVFHGEYTLPHDIRLMSLTPQANLLCRSWEVFAMRPGERDPVKLLKIKDWNFNWKETYHFESPVSLPAGTVIHALAHYDNTIDNPCNPSDMPIAFTLGSHLFNELFYVHFEYVVDHNLKPKSRS
ncbi:MAG TPA: cytochrome c [Saprospiraceae bacterium]|nr:cytochrome c [Saprospiraceae bacterium]